MKFKSDCSHSDWFIARMRGTRVRWQCRDCGHLDPWVKNDNPVKNDNTPTIEVDSQWDNKTVGDLRALAKEAGITGYSKMNKPMLIEHLRTVNEKPVLV